MASVYPNQLRMYVPDFCASKRIGNYIKMKHPMLSGIIGKQETAYIFYSKEEFLSILDSVNDCRPTGLRVYFADYVLLPDRDSDAADNNSLMPTGMEDTLTLIFAPTRSNGETETETGDYFILDPGGNTVNLRDHEGVADRWINDFHVTKYLPLNDMLQSIDTSLFESNSIWYDNGRISELRTFLNTDDAYEVEGIMAFFGAYHLADPDAENNPNRGRLTILFAFMSGYNNYYYYCNETENDTATPSATTSKGGCMDTGTPPPGN